MIRACELHMHRQDLEKLLPLWPTRINWVFLAAHVVGRGFCCHMPQCRWAMHEKWAQCGCEFLLISLSANEKHFPEELDTLPLQYGTRGGFLIGALLLNAVAEILSRVERRHLARNYSKVVRLAKDCVWNWQCLKMTLLGFQKLQKEFLEQYTEVLIIKESDI